MNSFSRFAKVSVVLANFLFHKIKESYPRRTLHRANGPRLESVEEIFRVWPCNVLSSKMKPMFSTLSVLFRPMYGNPDSGIRKILSCGIRKAGRFESVIQIKKSGIPLTIGHCLGLPLIHEANCPVLQDFSLYSRQRFFQLSAQYTKH